MHLTKSATLQYLEAFAYFRKISASQEDVHFHLWEVGDLVGIGPGAGRPLYFQRVFYHNQ